MSTPPINKEVFPVVEMFSSIQGEGVFSGKPAEFIRLGGCNLACPFCDEPLHKQKNLWRYYSADEIASLISSSAGLIVITGGEPTLYDCNPLIEALWTNGKAVQVETNGLNLLNARNADVISISPKQANWRCSYNAGPGQNLELKVPYPYFSDDETLALIAEGKRAEMLIWLTPINNELSINTENVEKTIAFIKQHSLEREVRLNTQVHKVLGVR